MSSVDLPRCQLEQAKPHPLVAALLAWVVRVGPFWAASVAGHLALFIVVALVLGTVHVARTLIDVDPLEVAVNTVIPDSAPLEHIILPSTPLEPSNLDIDPPVTDGLKIIAEQPPLGGIAPPLGAPSGDFADRFLNINGKVKGIASRSEPGLTDRVGGGAGATGGQPRGVPGGEIANRNPGIKIGDGRTRDTDRSVEAALDWFARHQAIDGGWSLGAYTRQCTDTTCTGAGVLRSDAAATAFAMLPFLAAGQTHQKGMYKRTTYGGSFWLAKHQAADGNLAAGSSALMYTHGLATICLCEAFAMTKDKQLGAAAQAGIQFIEASQNKDDGGWRYTPGQAGDTSVTGWQVMALKSGQMAGLAVDAAVMDLAGKYLKSASAHSKHGGLFGYLPESGPSPTMTAVGLLCTQYFGATRDDPSLAEGHAYLMKLLPDISRRNSYYWYYATQVMHNLPGTDWDTWNRAMRRTLIKTQVREGCATGSWDPRKPVADGNWEPGGRIMTTSLATLTLEVYYRYLPLYTLDKKDLAHRPADQ